ncbi:9542_t:CDS:2 [Gigaspora margarita]|uniref:9542_t:CDS:1 n=1 Tax=Gigaspora margarita TaxID=4874 RepID=A0ABN7UYP7_GIGMA|nr:9542_t:CDS:2 [Gigaspora margarita]
MAQYLYFNATLVDFTVIELDDENKNIVALYWYCNNKKNKINQENVIFANSDASKAQQNQRVPLISQPFTSFITLLLK